MMLGKQLPWCAMIVSTLLAGCSVLTVDVDVYKGPLANHNDVQTQQTVYLAVAAKPMLAKLRYLLEYRAVEGRYGTNPNFEMILRDRLDYIEPGEPASEGQDVPLTEGANRYRFRSSEAAYVNEIFKLYANAEQRNYVSEQLQTLGGNGTRVMAVASSDQITRGWQAKAATQPSTSLEQAKPGLGIESLLAVYEQSARALFSARNDNSDTDDYRDRLAYAEVAHKKNRDELFSRLIFFSQTLLFVANNDVLVKQLDDQPSIGSQALNAATPILGGRPDNLSYTRVLQTIGNSILVQVDELRQHATYDARMNDLHAVEVEAKAALQIKRADDVIEQLSSALQGRALAAGRGLSDGNVATLTAAYDEEVKTRDKLDKERAIADDDAAAARKALGAAQLSQTRVSRFFAINEPLYADHLKKHKGVETESSESYYNAVAGEQGTLQWLIDNKTTPEQLKIESQDVKNQLADLELVATFKANADSSRNVLFDKLREATNTHLRRILNLDELEKKDAAAADVASLKRDEARRAAAIVTQRLEQLQAERARALWESAVNEWKKEREQNPGASALNAVEQIRVARVHIAQVRSVENAVEADLISDAIDDVAKAAGVFRPIGDRSPVDVLDQIIATYRQQLIDVIARESTQSPKVKQLEAAIAEADRQRSAFTYIRPASSYLRTSNTATSLQRDARLYWNNTLLDQSVQSIPILGGLASNPPANDVRTVLELDKQFWHNINTVRVSGGGRTNYVLAKDDVGNWYVKNYSADPEPVIKGALGLVQFAAAGMNAGGALSTAVTQDAAAKIASGKAKGAKVDELIKRVQAARLAEGGPAATQPTLTAADASLLAQQVQGLNVVYVSESRQAVNAFVTDSAALDALIVKQWAGVDDFEKLSEARKTALIAARTAASAELKALPAPVADTADADALATFIPAARAASKYRRALLVALAALPEPAADASAADKLDHTITLAASKSVDVALGTFINGGVMQVQRILQRNADGIGLVERSTNSTPPAPPP
jgi:hypothetical protein